jgi:Helitron helicase-like domain at N-terminus
MSKYFYVYFFPRLTFLRNNQNLLMSETRQGLKDFVDAQAVRLGLDVGKVVSIPSSFVGGPAYYQEAFLNCMRLTVEYGQADLFITMTMDPSCPEVIDELGRRETSAGRPDQVLKVFLLKLDMLMELIDPKQKGSPGHFGITSAWTHAIEFQKRGLPHAHLLVWLSYA